MKSKRKSIIIIKEKRKNEFKDEMVLVPNEKKATKPHSKQKHEPPARFQQFQKRKQKDYFLEEPVKVDKNFKKHV